MCMRTPSTSNGVDTIDARAEERRNIHNIKIFVGARHAGFGLA